VFYVLNLKVQNNFKQFGEIMIIILFLFLFTEVGAENTVKDVPQTVPQVDLQRYAGLWYEIAKIPNRFQKKCAGHTTAEYTLRDDNKIRVVNRCVKEDGSVEEIEGIAKVVDPVSQTRLKVSFFRPLGISLFWGDYWIIGLGQDYEYAIVGTPNRKYGWILSRKPQLSKDKLEDIFQQLREQGYRPEDFQMTPQD
jgi:apolipoprotein D and lipocalin family protein